MNKEEILFQYQVKTKSQYGTRFYYFYADTDIENYLNNKNIKYVRYAKDTALNKKEKRIKELFKENEHYKHIIDELKKYILEEFNRNIEFFEGTKFLKGGYTFNQNILKNNILNKLQKLKESE